MILGGAEHDGFLHPACCLEIGRYFLRNLLGAVLEYDIVVKVLVGIDAILNLLA